MAVHSAAMVVLNNKTNPKYNCDQRLTFAAAESNIASFHTSASEIYLEKCNIEELITASELTKLEIIKSNVTLLQAMAPLLPGKIASIHDSEINNLEKLIVDTGSSLVIMNSIINNIKAQGLEIKNGSVTIVDSFIREIIEGFLSLENFQGNVTLKKNTTIPLDITIIDCECQENYGHVVSFYIMLILFIISWIVFLLYINKDTIFEKRTSPRPSQVQRSEGDEQTANSPEKNITQEKRELEGLLKDNNHDNDQRQKNENNKQLESSEIEYVKEKIKESQKMLGNIIITETDPRDLTCLSIEEIDKTDFQFHENSIQNSDLKTDKFSKQLESMCEILEKKYSYLKNMKGQEGIVLNIFRNTSEKNIFDTFPCVKEFLKDIENLLKKCDSSKTDKIITDSVRKCKKELDTLVKDVGKSISMNRVQNETKDNEYKFTWPASFIPQGTLFKDFYSSISTNQEQKETKANEYKITLPGNFVSQVTESVGLSDSKGPEIENSITDNNHFDVEVADEAFDELDNEQTTKPEGEKQNMVYVLSATQFTSLCISVSELQEDCLNQYFSLVNWNIKYVEKITLLLLHIHISFSKFVLSESGHTEHRLSKDRL